MESQDLIWEQNVIYKSNLVWLKCSHCSWSNASRDGRKEKGKAERERSGDEVPALRTPARNPSWTQLRLRVTNRLWAVTNISHVTPNGANSPSGETPWKKPWISNWNALLCADTNCIFRRDGKQRGLPPLWFWAVTRKASWFFISISQRTWGAGAQVTLQSSSYRISRERNTLGARRVQIPLVSKGFARVSTHTNLT